MSKTENEVKNQLARSGHPTIDEPMDNSDWDVRGSVINENGRPVGVNFSGNIDGAGLSGQVKSGSANVKVSGNDSFLNLSYKNEHVTGTVGYVVGNDQASLTGTFDSNGNLSGSGRVKFKDATFDISPSSVGASLDFGGGWSGSVSQQFGGGMGINFSGGSSFGGGSSFSLGFGAQSSGGSWGVNAKFQLIILTN
ncbi:MAG TPA: hypothetical protein VES70_27795 [Pseudomonas sp.]|nr:hypothetical protein [Pseudomonas sp.]